MSASNTDTQLLKLEGIRMHFSKTTGGIFSHKKSVVRAVDGVDLEVYPGQIVGLVGESGCGKTTVGRTALRLYEPSAGTITFDGTDITHLKQHQLKPLRSKMQMIFQDPSASLNPRHTAGTIISAPFVIQGIAPKGGVMAEVQRLMERVGLNPEHINRYPHEFSGGQAQRIGIARAIALKPKLIIADEPVSALDVSIRAQIINLLKDLQTEFGMSYLFVAHDLPIVQHIADRVVVMYLGKVMEEADKKDLFATPKHPYTKALLSAVPITDPRGAKDEERQSTRIILTGELPNPANPPSGCVFRTRCWQAQEKCSTEVPQLRLLSNISDHKLACHFPVD